MSASPLPTRQPVLRWGLGDVAWVWFAGFAAAIVAGSAALAVRGAGSGHRADGVDLAVAVVAQNAVMLLVAVLVSRGKGRGRLSADFGLVVRVRDWPWLAYGVLLQAAAFGAQELVRMAAGGNELSQDVARAVERASGPELAVAAIAIVGLVPVAEELLFRGILLRSLARRTSVGAAVAGSAVLFALAHLVSPSAAAVLAPLLALGVVSGLAAVRTGELSQSILLHGGFNLLGVIGLLAVVSGH